MGIQKAGTAIRKDNTNQVMGARLARFFSASVLRELAQSGHSEIAARLSRQNHLFDQFCSTMQVGEFYDAIFMRLVKDYRHEYIYKNAIAEKILLGKHNLKTAFMLTEFRVADCKADAVVLNGTSHVYEIKSEMDSFERLDRQLAAYRQMFDYITVITTERLYQSVQERVPQEIGIMVLAEGKYQFKAQKCRREAVSNKSNVDPLVIFDSLQRREFLEIIKTHCGVSFNHTPNTRIYAEARNVFKQLPPETAHDAMVDVLKQRRETHRVADFVLDVPASLKAASLSLRLTQAERSRFVSLLKKDIASAFA